ncbi:hypothetical protein BKA62DRAFT_769577 [Auriculariales sp. MPI-PUGE-AT-0066]|nr:hypothetical protein BKA62DRAFT_769577 [Auriculariales sp. MPI-PUGE-AT-0066]
MFFGKKASSKGPETAKGLNDALFTPNGQHSFEITPPPPSTWPARWNPVPMRGWYVCTFGAVFIAFAVGIEVAYYFSKKQKGFNATSHPWGLSSTQFLKSFLSSLFIFPLVYVYRKQDEFNKIIQPYIDLQQGKATAERSLLLSYVLSNPIRSIFSGLANKHNVIVVSAIGSVLAMLLQPLAGSLFTIRPTELDLPDTPILARTQLGVVPGFEDLEAFVAAAGYADAAGGFQIVHSVTIDSIIIAAFHDLADPPFVKGIWAVTEFEIPEDKRSNNGSIQVQTIGIKSTANCEAPSYQTFNRGTTTGNYSLQATFSSCRTEITVNPSNDDFAGVQAVPDCDDNKNIEVTPKTDPIDQFPPANNVSDLLAAGPLSGVTFDPWIGTNDLFRARAIAIQSQLPAAGLRLARKVLGGAEALQQNATGFQAVTERVYTQYLAIVAKSVYFQTAQAPLNGQLTQWQPRLWLDPLACHSLAGILVTIGLFMIFGHFGYSKTRTKIYLAVPPGTIASAITLTSNSRWTAMLTAADDQNSLEHKLRDMRFQLDPVTHHIIVQGEAIGQPLNGVPANSPILDKRYSGFQSLAMSMPSTPGVNSKDPGAFTMNELHHSALTVPVPNSPLRTSPTSPGAAVGFPQPVTSPEAQRLLSPYQDPYAAYAAQRQQYDP